MFDKIKMIAASAVVALGAITAVPATAQADSFYFGIGGGATDVQFRFRENDRDRHGPRFGRDRGCSVREALNKAQRMGLRRVHVRGENRRVIRVAGSQRGRTVIVAFANARNCPVIR